MDWLTMMVFEFLSAMADTYSQESPLNRLVLHLAN